MARVLGVDVGTVRTGLALSDPDGVVATPLATVDAAAEPTEVADQVVAAAHEHCCTHIVLGLPRSMSGRDTASAARVRAIAGVLRERGLHVSLWDERLSSAEAERALLQAGRRRAQRRVERDRVAAAIILQGWLDAQPTTRK